MKFNRSVFTLLVGFLLAVNAFAQANSTGSTGSIKGKVRVETGAPAGVTVVVRQGEREVTRVLTDKKGEFTISRLSPGEYGVTLRKTGLSVGTIENIEVRAGKTHSLGNNLVMSIDEGSIAFIRGSVFNKDDRSAANVRIELARIQDDGTVKKIDGRVTNEIGAFVFRLSPESAKYRVTAKPSGGEPVSKDVDVDGAAVYRLALSLKPPSK
jgi:carboxypeptidase family protein